MRRVFVDTSYYIAVINRHDNLHDRALKVSKGLREVQFVTSQMVLVELLAFYARRGGHFRLVASRLCQELNHHPLVQVIPQTSELFWRSADRYAERIDKSWSPVDCASMILMEEMGIEDILTADHHFSQAGFNPLLHPASP